MTKPAAESLGWGINGGEGQEKWSSQFDVASSWGRMDSQETGNAVGLGRCSS